MRKIKTFVCVWASAATLLTVLLVGMAFHTSEAHSMDASLSPTPTEATGGLMGSLLGELRCPTNLSGEGPSWRGIIVGQSTVGDLKALYAPYKGDVSFEATPFAPFTANFPKGEYALNYVIDIDLDRFQPQLGLPRLLRACIVNGKIAALVILASDDPTVPHSIEQIVSLLGPPTLISWHEDGGTIRILHWPTEGVSAQVSSYVVVDYIYFYPYLGADYKHKWPINSILTVAPTVHPDEPQPTLDNLNLSVLELTLTVSPAWPTRTPHSSATLPHSTPSSTATVQ